MTDDTRGRILAKVRGAGSGASADAVLRAREGLGRAPSADLRAESLPVAFLASVLLNQGTIAVAGNRSEAAQKVASYLYDRHRTHRVVAGNDRRLAALPWRDGGVLPRFGAAVDGDAAAVSYAKLGVAETGSVLVCSGRSNPSANNWLVEDHIVLVDAEQLVVDFEAAWASLGELAQRPRGIHFISGPSSTADIIGHLVKGAHGPRGWHVILVGPLLEEITAAAYVAAGVTPVQS